MGQLALYLPLTVVYFSHLYDSSRTSCQMYHPSFDYGAPCDNAAMYNNDKYHRPSYFSKNDTCASVHFRFVHSGQIPSLSRRDSVKFLTIRISRVRGKGDRLPFYLYEILLRQKSTRRSGIRAVAAAARRKDIPRAPLVGLIERVPSQPYFCPSSHELVNPRSPGRTSVNIDVNLEERNG